MGKRQQQYFETEGFSFQNEKQAAQAQKEIAGVKYIKSKMDMDNPEMVLQIYNKCIRDNLFETPVGFSFLKEIQDYLYAIPYVKNEDVLSIPVYYMIERIDEAEKASHPQKQKKEKVEKKTVINQKNIDFRARYRVTFALTVILFFMVIGMFAITLSSDSTTILNYENKIINKYEDWEQNLNQREADLDAREAELNQK